MTTRYFVTYDVADPKRLARVFRVMKSAGLHVQFSVFCCDLTERQCETLKMDLLDVIKPSEDQVLFVDLGPTEGQALERVTSLGRACDLPRPGPFIG